MILLDTNVLIYAFATASDFKAWARSVIAEGVAQGGVAINPVTLAELCVGDAAPDSVADRVRSWDVDIIDIPVAAAELSARAYRDYRRRRQRETIKPPSLVPLPDFFIGAHAEVMGWPLATADVDHYKIYFPKVKLKLP